MGLRIEAAREGRAAPDQAMPDRSETELFEAIAAGDAVAFERIYDIYQQRARLTAWRISHRADWVDDILNEAWCRAYSQRRLFDPARPFLVWLAGILQNVYREHCRKSPVTYDGDVETQATTTAGSPRLDEDSPEKIAAEAELLAGLNDCLERMDPLAVRIVRLRFFEGRTLRLVAQEVNIPESTLREVRLPAVYRALRQCLARKGIEISQVFPAQAGGPRQ